MPRLSARSRTMLAASGAVVLVAAALAAASPASAEGYDVVAVGLDNPRQLSFTGDTLYVAEAGRGGAGACVEGAEGEVCFGLTGAVTRVRAGQQTRVLSGLPSLADKVTGGGASGPADVVVTGQQKYAVTMGLGNNPSVRTAELAGVGRLFGTLVTGAFSNAGPRLTADLGAYEVAVDPDGEGADSNPTGLIAVGGGYALTDSGANTLLSVRGGRVSTLAVFGSRLVPTPPFLPPGLMPMQAVPTSVAVGPDGGYYVSQLTGFPFPVGGSNIYRVVPGHAPTVYATGLTNVTDLAWDGDDLYAVQLADGGLLGGAPVGSLLRVGEGGSHTMVAGGLFAPYGVALHDGSAYVTTCSLCAGGGQVIEIPLG